MKRKLFFQQLFRTKKEKKKRTERVKFSETKKIFIEKCTYRNEKVLLLAASRLFTAMNYRERESTVSDIQNSSY